ncbi:Myelin-associated oligodendrocyte basic protein isoform 2 [Gossypium australe]|uniref:Myelin-associated oligodendrocyte basic protein isoform 2 n=1 Tax=Gossypium australe TaxID=47621 RepID=A0A5B6VV18_9ROSI|nr:Myelin-associated oligodendrocyte basic protein isoform 2 [Gossypium australe]
MADSEALSLDVCLSVTVYFRSSYCGFLVYELPLNSQLDCHMHEFVHIIYCQVDVKQSIYDGEKRFNQLSIEERGKFDEETLVNVNNIRRQSTSSQKASGFSNEYIVITILVAAEGMHKLPPINGSGDLKEALQKLASIPSSKILAVEVLWTPQNENDTLSERELLEDYPLLRPL